MMDWNKYSNTAFEAPEKIRAVQQEQLRTHVAYCAKQSPFYQTMFKALDILPEEITLETLSRLPCTDKTDFEQHADALLAVDPSRVVDIVFSSGTSGEPTAVMYTRSDLQRLAYNESQSFRSCGVTAFDVALLTCTLDRCFVAGMAYFMGLKQLGVSSIRNGHGSLESHQEVIARMHPTMIVGVPSFLHKLGGYLLKHGFDPAKNTIKKLVCIGEPLRDQALKLTPLGEQLQALWEAPVYSTYASSEIVTTFCECTAQQGGHLHPELGIVEIVDDQRRTVPAGDLGEVVVTPMGIQGMPLIRFCTGDLSFLIEEPCSCGRNAVRLGPIVGRKKQMLKVKGTTLYPPAVNAVLDAVPEVLEYYVSVCPDEFLSDSVTVHVAVSEPSFSAEILAEKLQARLRVCPHVLIEPLQDVRSKVHTAKYRKPIRFVDFR